jgi:hypothetical protein
MRCVHHLFGNEGYGDIFPTFITKSAGWWIHFAAFWAFSFQFMAAFIAEYSIIWILMLAFWAIHYDDLQLKAKKLK